MYYRLEDGPKNKYVVINEFREITQDNESFNKTYQLKLANGMTKNLTLSHSDANQMLASFLKGGVVVNP